MHYNQKNEVKVFFDLIKQKHPVTLHVLALQLEVLPVLIAPPAHNIPCGRLRNDYWISPDGLNEHASEQQR